ncbi:MAG: hypothetical protein QXG98_01680 [Candidatus Micrarchaeia archaeon]
MRGFLISLDAVLAVLLAFFFLATSLLIAGNIKSVASEEAQLKRVSEDVLAVLERTGRLALTPEAGGASEVTEVFLSAPDSACFRLRVLRASDLKIRRVVVRPGCGEPEESHQVTKRSFVFGREFYIAELTSWRRRA